MANGGTGSVGFSIHHNIHENIFGDSMCQIYDASGLPTTSVRPSDSGGVTPDFNCSLKSCEFRINIGCKSECHGAILDVQNELSSFVPELVFSDDLSLKFESISSDVSLDVSSVLLQGSKEDILSDSSILSKSRSFLNRSTYLEYPDEIPDGKGGMRKRKHSFWQYYGSDYPSVKKRKMVEAWDPQQKQVVELPYSTMLNRKIDRLDEYGSPISRSKAFSRTIVGFDEDGNPLSRSKAYNRAIVGVDNDGSSVSRSKAYSRAIVAYDNDGTPISRSKVCDRTIVGFDGDGNPLSRSKAYGRVIVGFDEDGTPISRSKARGRTIVAYDDDGTPISRSKARDRTIIGFDEDGQPLSRSKARHRVIVAFDDKNCPISQSKAYKRTVLGYDKRNKAVSRSAAWKRYVKAVPKKDRVPKTGFLDWCSQHLTQKPACES